MKRYPHADNCKCGATAEQLPLTKDHEWWVDSDEHHNCFWTYFRHNTRSHTLNEVANLLGLSISAITSIERKATAKLRKKLKHLENEVK